MSGLLPWLRSMSGGAALVVLLLCCCAQAFAVGVVTPAPTLRHEAYVWQRQWTTAVPAAIRRLQTALSGLRVLALQYDSVRGWTEPSAVDVDALSALPVVLVVRLEQLPAAGQRAQTLQRLWELVQRWRETDRVQVRGLEIDFDCASSKLPDYTEFLQALRNRLSAELRSGLRPELLLSITALPTWLDSADVLPLVQSVDQIVLQLHALQRPPAPLFNARQAQRWIQQLQDLSDRRFLIALPTYGSQVHLAADHSILAVQSEQQLGNLGGAQVIEQYAAAPALWAFVRELEAQPRAGLDGIVWFRLPTVRDQRAWSPLTLAAVIEGTALAARLRVELRRSSAARSFDVLLRNLGTLDGALPQQIRLPADCHDGDGAGPFVFADAGRQFELKQARSLAPGRHQMVGWVRCQTLEAADVELVW